MKTKHHNTPKQLAVLALGRAEQAALRQLMRARGWKWSPYLTAWVPR